MVSLRKHWHFAHEHDLFGENRFLAFAGTGTPDPMSGDEEEKVEKKPEEVDVETKMNIEALNEENRRKFAHMLEKKEVGKSIDINELNKKNAAAFGVADAEDQNAETADEELVDMNIDKLNKKNEKALAGMKKHEVDKKKKAEEEAEAQRLKEAEEKKRQEEAAAEEERKKKLQAERLEKKKALEVQLEAFRAGAVYEQTKNVSGTLSDYIAKLTDAELLGRIDADTQKDWKDAAKVMKEQEEQMKNWEEAAHFLAEWKAGNISPQDLRSYLEKNLESDPQKDKKAAKARDELLKSLKQMIDASQGKPTTVLIDYDIPDVTDPDKWGTLNQSDRLTIVSLFMENGLLKGSMEKILEIIGEGTDQVHRALHHGEDAIKKEIDTVEKGAYPKELPAARGYLTRIMNIPRQVGIEFYSVYDLVDGVKLTIKSYKDAFEDRKHRKSALVATQFGKVIRHLPFGEDVNIVIERNLDSAEDEIKGKYLEYLKRRRPEFTELIDENHGEIAMNLHDKNRTRAILEYAASRGWLYDLDRTVDAKQKFILGYPLEDLVPTEWDDTRRMNYWMTLRSENAGGVDHEIKHGHELVRDNENTPFFVHEIAHELHHGNIWGAVGIAERAIERGLWAEVSPWLTTTFMRAMRENPVIRKYMGLTALDRIGGLSLYRSAFTLGQFKGDRNTLNIWLRRDDTDIKKAGMLGETIALIEEDIKSKSHLDFTSEKGKEDLDHRVALVLAGHTLKLDNEKVVTIFDERYKDYRHGPAITKQGDLSPGVEKEDPDYFTQICENIMAGQPVVAQIMARTGQGTFRNDIKTGFYTGHLVSLYLDLKEKGADNPTIDKAAENFRKEMGEKMSHWMSEDPLGDSRSPGLHRAVMRGDFRVENKPILNTLLLNGFIDVEVLMRAILKEENGKALADQILRENAINVRKPELYDRLKAIVKEQASADQYKQKELDARYEELVRDWRKAQDHDVTWEAKYMKAPVKEKGHGGTETAPSGLAH